jgi:diguanylate cyclase (GGDEF)-like protein/PAS domain S-box-containing protein
MSSFSASPPIEISALDSADLPKAVSDFDRVENTVSSLMSVSSLALNPDAIIRAFDPLPAGVVLYDSQDHLVFCNRRFREIYSGVADLLVVGNAYADITRAFYRRGLAVHNGLDEDAYVKARVEKHSNPDASDFEILLEEGRYLLISDRKTADGGVIGFRVDITERKTAERELAASEERFRSLLAMSSDWYWEQDKNFQFSRISGGMSRATGVNPAQRIGSPRWEIPYLGISKEQMDEHRRAVEAHERFRDFQYAYAMPSGEIWWVSISGEPVFTADGEFNGYRGVGSNITEKRRTEAQIRELAEYDFLTGLPNRMLLSARFDFALRQAKRQHEGIALMFIDLDRFKNINDSLGHHIGDQILAETARRLLEATRATDTVSRHGGDEFVLMLPGASDASNLAQLADALLKKLGAPHRISGHELTVTPSIGLTIWPHDGEDLNSLVKNADLAMYHSKSEGRNQYSFFRPEMNQRVTERLSVENALRRALLRNRSRNEFSLVYQPIFSIPARELIGVEALLRWNSEELGEVPPSKFIPVAEDSGLIIELGEWVAHEACAQLARWHEAGLRKFPVTINVSGVQFKSRRLVEQLQDAIRANGLDARDLEIELTESALVSEGDAASSTLDAMALAGFRLVVDDFGTGYSNLVYLKRFDIAKLKIDQSFVRDITTDPDDAAITRGIIGLAKSLGLRVVAEGIEHSAQLEFLRASGCEEAQGFLLSHPLTPEALQEKFNAKVQDAKI